MKKFLFSTIIFALVLTSGNADDLGIANDFNAFIFSDANTIGGQSDGAVAVGGHWDMGYAVNRNNLGASTITGNPNVAMVVGGSITTQGVARSLHGDVYVGQRITGTLDVQNGQLNPDRISYRFNEQEEYSRVQSSYLASLTGQAINVSDPNNINVNLRANTRNGNLKVYNVNASELSTLSTLNLSGGNGNETVVVNVRGHADVNWGWQVNYPNKNRLVWNFLDTRNIFVANRDFAGSMIVQYATVSQVKNIRGTMIARRWVSGNGAELHFGNQYKFNGHLPYAPVPEPATLLVLGAGAVAFIRRRRSNQA